MMAVEARPRIVIMPGNDVLSDPRSMKNLATAAAFGLDAIGLGVVRAGAGRDLAVGSARVIIVPVPPRLGVAGARGWWRQLGELLHPWYRTDSEERRARARLSYGAKEAAAGAARATRDATRVPLVRPVPSTGPWGHLVSMLKRLGLIAGKVTVRTRSVPLRRRRARELEQHEVDEKRRATSVARHRRWPCRSRWRTELPVAVDDEVVIGRVLDELAPDLIHVHDVFMMGVAARAAGRAAVMGRTIRLVYDAREYLPGLAYLPSRTVAAYCDLEHEFIADFDRVVTVSQPLAELLQKDHGLVRAPDLVLNAPVVDPDTEGVPDLRAAIGLASGVPLIVYGGGVNPARGVQTVVDALPSLPGVHLALVVNTTSRVVVELQRRAERQGVGDRVHLAPFVAPDQVTRYIASADIGISPLLHVVNHDVALTNKFCEYVVAGLPIVTSDTPAQADLVRELGLGEVFRAGDVADLERAVRAVLGSSEAIRERMVADDVQRRFSWHAQACVLRDVYGGLLGGLPAAAWGPAATRITRVPTAGAGADE